MSRNRTAAVLITLYFVMCKFVCTLSPFILGLYAEIVISVQ